MCKKWFRELGHRRCFLCLWFVFLVTGLCGSSTPLYAQAPVPVEQPTEDIAQGDTPLTSEAIQALKTQAAESSELDAPTKAKLQDLYDQILTQLKEAKEQQDLRLSYVQNREAVPGKLETLKATREQPGLPALPDSLASQDQIQQALSQASLEVEQARTKSQELEQEPKRRADRRTLIPEQVGTLKQSLLALDEQIKTPAQTTAIDKANVHLLRAKKQAQINRMDALNAELLLYDASRELLSLRRDKATRVLEAWQARVTVLQDRLNQLHKAEAEKTRVQAIQATQQVEKFHPIVQRVAQANSELAQKQKDLTTDLQKASEQEIAVNAQFQTLKADKDSVTERLEKSYKVTHVARNLLRLERNKLNKQYNVQANRRSIKERLSLITQTQSNIYDYDQTWTKLRDIQAIIEGLLSDSEPPVPENQRTATRAKLEELLQSQRTIIQRLSELSFDYSGALANLDVTERQLVNLVNEYQRFIAERVLWVRTGSISDLLKPGPLWAAMQWLISPSRWQAVGLALWNDLHAQPEFYGLALMGLLLITLVRHRVIKRIANLKEKTRHAPL